MILDCALTDAKIRGYYLTRLSGDDQRHDLRLSRGEITTATMVAIVMFSVH